MAVFASSSSLEAQFDLALALLNQQLCPQQLPVTSAARGDAVTRSSAAESSFQLLAALSSADRGDGADTPAATTAEGPWTPPSTPTAVSAMTADSRRYKTELCRAYEERGLCRYGDRCQFAHGVDELRSLQRHPKYKTELCRTYHTSGFCPYGARCHFVHNGCPTPPAAPPSTPRDLDACHHTDPGFPAAAARSSTGVMGCAAAVPDEIQLTLLSAALEKLSVSTHAATGTTVSICVLLIIIIIVVVVVIAGRAFTGA